MKAYYIFIFALLCSVSASAQNIHNTVLRWISDRTDNQKNNDAFQFSSTFVTSSTEVKWFQKNGQYTTVFYIVSAEGRWSDISKPGKVKFQVTEKGNNNTGYILFERSEQAIAILLDFSSLGEHGLRQKFYVTDIQKEN